MTKKDYELIAGVIRSAGLGYLTAMIFAETLKTTNPQFNVKKFIAACLKE